VTEVRGKHEPCSSEHVSRRIRVFVADDVSEVIDVVEQRLNSEYEIVGRANDGVALVEGVCELRPDILITDISMPRLTGIEALRKLRDLGVKTPTVILSVHEDEELAREALLRGALGFVLKSRLQDDLLVAVQEALAGRTFISERLRKRMPEINR
jgi:DNA-binding NarL/FixJ family response regulator